MEKALAYLQERKAELGESLETTRRIIRLKNLELINLKNTESNIIQEIESIDRVQAQIGNIPEK